MEQCVAIADYDALEEDEISFRTGDVLYVTAKGSASGFWEGYVISSADGSIRLSAQSIAAAGNGDGERYVVEPANVKRGWFPNCFVSSNLRPTSMQTLFQNKAVCLYDYAAADDSEMSFHRGDLITAVRPSASPGWWYGVNETVARAHAAEGGGGGTGSGAAASETPSRRRRGRPTPLESGLDDDLELPYGIHKSVSDGPLLLLFPSNFVTCNVVQAAFAFEGRQSHELSFDAGDVIVVHRRWNDGWWEGSLRGRRGIFPSNYTVPNVASTDPPFFCQRCKTVFSADTEHPSAGTGAAQQQQQQPIMNSTASVAPMWARCACCMRHEEITDWMLRALDAYGKGEMKALDLFAYVEIEPRSSAAEAAPSATPEDHDVAVGVERDSHDDEADESDDGKSNTLRSAAPPSLLTERDVADVASGRVKF